MLKPDFYETSFLVTEKETEVPKTIIDTKNIESKTNDSVWIIPIIGIILIFVFAAYVKRKYQHNP